MRAPVYRHLDTKATFLGLTFPVEWAVVVLPVVVGARFDFVFSALLGALALYVFLRLIGHGRPPDFLQHWILFRIRALSRGRFSAAARAPAPRFPFGSYLSRDAAPRRR